MKRPAGAVLDTNIVLSALKGQSSCAIFTAEDTAFDHGCGICSGTKSGCATFTGSTSSRTFATV